MSLLRTEREAGVPIIVASCDRQPQYIDQTLESMWAQDELARQHFVRILVCGPDADYLERWSHPGGPWIDVLPSEEWERVSALEPKHRTGHNLYRGLCRHGEAVYLQDDVVFSHDWLGRLGAMVREIERQHEGEPFMVSLYAPYRLTGAPVTRYPAERFYGMQGMYINEAAARGLHAFMGRAIGSGGYRPDDELVKAYLLESGTPLYAANPSLVQHIGIVSAIEARHHESPSFVEG